MRAMENTRIVDGLVSIAISGMKDIRMLLMYTC